MKNTIILLTCILIFSSCQKSTNQNVKANPADKYAPKKQKDDPTNIALHGGQDANGCFVWGNAIRVGSYNTSPNTCYFMLTSSLGITMQIETWEIGTGIKKAHGWVTSFSGAATYGVVENPIAPTSKLQVSFTVCSKPYNGTSCTSACCEWGSCTFTGYLYKEGVDDEGLPRFWLYKTLQ